MPTKTLHTWTDEHGTNRVTVEQYDDSPTVYIRHEVVANGNTDIELEITLSPGVGIRINDRDPTSSAVLTTGFRVRSPYGNPRKHVRERTLIDMEVDNGTPTAVITEQESRPERRGNTGEWSHGAWEDTSETVVTTNGIESSSSLKEKPGQAPDDASGFDLPASLQ
jgi:hypothetical protein